MFSTRKRLELLEAKYAALEKQVRDNHNKLNSKVVQFERHSDSNGKIIERMQKHLGVETDSYGLFGSIYDVFRSSHVVEEAKPLTLTGKVEAILEHLGLQENLKTEAKLIKKPVEKKKKGTK